MGRFPAGFCLSFLSSTALSRYVSVDGVMVGVGAVSFWAWVGVVGMVVLRIISHIRG